jgi:RHS repeat-associated protein
VATDNAGDQTTGSQVAVVANAQPTVSITAPASGAIVQPPGALTLSATAADSDGTVSKLDFYQGSTLLGTAATAPYAFSIPSLPAGSYSFTAVAADDRGGSTTSTPLSVIVNAPPTIALTSPANNSSFKAPASISISANAGDSDGNVTSVAFYYGDTLITTLTAAPYTFTWTGVPQGTYALTARVTDNTGDTISSDPISVTVTPAVGQLYFIEVDHLNTPRLVADAAGMTVWKWDQQEPFGDSVTDQSPSGLGAFELPLRLPGQRYDAETALHYNYYRDYDPSLGRYGESDPIGLRGGINAYLYVNADPLSFTDPSGLIPQGSDPECFRRGECKCATAECAGGLPPIDLRPTCCDKEKLAVCLAPRATGGMACVICAATEGKDQLACSRCAATGIGVANCFKQHCGKDKCNKTSSCKPGVAG